MGGFRDILIVKFVAIWEFDMQIVYPCSNDRFIKFNIKPVDISLLDVLSFEQLAPSCNALHLFSLTFHFFKFLNPFEFYFLTHTLILFTTAPN